MTPILHDFIKMTPRLDDFINEEQLLDVLPIFTSLPTSNSTPFPLTLINFNEFNSKVDFSSTPDSHKQIAIPSYHPLDSDE